MAYENVAGGGWPQIKQLQQWDDIAKKVNDMPTFTSEDKQALSDLIDNADALLALIPE